MLDAFIIKRIHEEKKRQDRRPSLEVDTPHRHPDHKEREKSKKPNANRGVTIIDFTI